MGICQSRFEIIFWHLRFKFDPQTIEIIDLPPKRSQRQLEHAMHKYQKAHRKLNEFLRMSVLRMVSWLNFVFPPFIRSFASVLDNQDKKNQNKDLHLR